jgi:hypothetical protein
VRLIACTELVAGDVFQRADQAGDVITMTLVARRIAELATHPRRCCCGLCAAARAVRPAHVYRVAAAWQWQIYATRARALR